MKKISLLSVIVILALMLAALSSCVSDETEDGAEPVAIEEGSPLAVLLAAYDKIADAGSYLVEVTTVTSMTLNGQTTQSDSHILAAETIREEDVDIHMMSWSTRTGEDNIVTSYYKDGWYYTDAGSLKTRRAMESLELAAYGYGTVPAVPITAILSQDAADTADTEGFEDIEDGVLMTFTLDGAAAMENLSVNLMSGGFFGANPGGANRNFAATGTGDIRTGQGREGAPPAAGGSPLPDIPTFTPNPDDTTMTEMDIKYADATAWALLDGKGNLISVWLEATYTMNFMGLETSATITYSYDFLAIGDITVSFPEDLDDYELTEAPQAPQTMQPPTPSTTAKP